MEYLILTLLVVNLGFTAYVADKNRTLSNQLITAALRANQ